MGSLYLSCVDICKSPQEASQLPHTDYQQTVWLFSILAFLGPHIYYSKSGFLINICCVSSTMLTIQVFIIRHLSTHPFIHVSTPLPIQPFTHLIIYHPLIYSSILPPTLSCSSSYWFIHSPIHPLNERYWAFLCTGFILGTTSTARK